MQSSEKVKNKNILVTGCGGDIGFGIGKILQQENIANLLIGCDVHTDHPASTIFDKCTVVVRVDNPSYLKTLESVVKEHKIDIVIPTSEPELRFFAKNKINSISNVPLIMANQKALEVGFDKYKTAEFLKENNLPYPWTQYVKDGLPQELPCIIKDPSGCGSKNIHIVDKENVEFYSSTQNDGIWQELLLPDNQEYTCGVYGTNAGEIKTIIFKRTLQGGFTGKGEVVQNSEIKSVLIKLAKALELKGAINVQLRLTDKGAIVFEINPRFSSTVVFRHKLGFKDLLWSLKEKFNEKIDDYVPLNGRIKFYRISEEVIINA